MIVLNIPIMKTLTEQFHATVEEFLERTGFKPTEFGRQAAGDPSLMLNLRRGRSPTLATADRILAFIEETDRANGRKAAARRKR
jgi:predicted transcriptional regulator